MAHPKTVSNQVHPPAFTDYFGLKTPLDSANLNLFGTLSNARAIAKVSMYPNAHYPLGYTDEYVQLNDKGWVVKTFTKDDDGTFKTKAVPSIHPNNYFDMTNQYSSIVLVDTNGEESDPVVEVEVNPNTPDVADFYIAGSASVGDTLEAVYRLSGYPYPDVNVVWTYNEVSETGDTFVVPQAAAGHEVTCELFFDDEETAEATLETDAVTMAPKNTVAFSITGTPEVGQTLTAAGTWAGFPTTVSTVTWYRNGTAVHTGATYVLDSDDEGAMITINVVGSNTEGTVHLQNIDAVGPIDPEPEDPEEP